MIRILVLGQSGMLGSMVVDYLSRNERIKVSATVRTLPRLGELPYDNVDFYEFDASGDVEKQLFVLNNIYQPEYIINCIGIIKPYCKDNDMNGVLKAIEVNARFPHHLCNGMKKINKNTGIIQIATDCVFDGVAGNYDENAFHNALDVYGKTKSLGEVIDENFLNIRCSIIGPEIHNKLSLLEWFLANNDGTTVNGFSHHKWNGVTTLQFAQLCERIIINNIFKDLRSKNHVIHYVVNETVTKDELLTLFNKVYNRHINIKSVDNIGDPIDRTIATIYYPQEILSMREALIELHNYTEKHYLLKGNTA